MNSYLAFIHSVVAILLALLGSSHLHAQSPGFTDTVQILETQKVTEAKPVYWDQAIADRLGLKPPPGSIGQPEFDKWIVENLGLEIMKGAKSIPNEKLMDSKKYFFVEKDAHGGAGRAGYIKVGESWLNIKGIGLTGVGNAKDKKIGPPSSSFVSHSDGSATLEEAVKEAIYGRMADNELKAGGSRVVSIINTGRTLSFSDGRKVPLALIIRAPLRRLDRDVEKKSSWKLVVDSLSEANMSKVFKGDFVNTSNMGSSGELVDYGCIGHTCGFIPAVSSQKAVMFHEVEEQAISPKMGYYLLNQLGIPEKNMEPAFKKDKKVFQQVSTDFRNLIFLNEKVLLDFEDVELEKLTGFADHNKFFEDFSHDFFKNPGQTETQFIEAQWTKYKELLKKDRIIKLVTRTTEINVENEIQMENEIKALLANIEAKAKAFFSSSYHAFKSIKLHRVIPNTKTFADSIKEVAKYKNRTITDLVRPYLFRDIGILVRSFEENPNPQNINQFIHERVYNNRLKTSAVADGDFITTVDGEKTSIHLRAYTDEKTGNKNLFTRPDLIGQGSGESLHFRVSTDNWKTFSDIPAQYIETSEMGTYFKIDIKHGDMPTTWDRAQLSPYAKDSNGKIRWLQDGLTIKGPSLFYNERLGLASDIIEGRQNMREVYKTPIKVSSEDMKPSLPSSADCNKIFSSLVK